MRIQPEAMQIKAQAILMVAMIGLTTFFSYGLSNWWVFVPIGIVLGVVQGTIWWKSVKGAQPQIGEAVSLREFQRILFSTNLGKLFRFVSWAWVVAAALVAFLSPEGSRLSIFVVICGATAAASALSQMVVVHFSVQSA